MPPRPRKHLKICLTEPLQLKSGMNSRVSLLQTNPTIIRNLAQTNRSPRIKLKVRRVGVGLRRVSPRCPKDQSCALTASSQVTLLGTVGNLGVGLKPLGGREAIPTRTKF